MIGRIAVAGWIVFAAPALGAELRVPAATAYLSPNAEGAQVSAKRGITGWRDPKVKVLWFGDIKSPGKLVASVALRLPKDAAFKLRLTVDGQTHEATANGSGPQQVVTVKFGDYAIAKPGYQTFALESRNTAGGQAAEIDSLILEGPAVEGAHFNLDARRNAASVHLNYQTPADAKIVWFYSEVTALKDPVTTFYMACGFSRGYFGMQVNSPKERRIIFSVWDAGTGASAKDRSKVDKENQVSLVAKGEGVTTSIFGNEGTGGHSHLKYMWKTEVPQRFLLTAEPAADKSTIYTGYYFHPDQKAWVLITSMKAPKDGGYLKRLHGFSENFGGSTGHLERKALYGNQWIRTADGQWTELTAATFSHDATGKKNRLDRYMGIQDNQFFLSHGGFLPGTGTSGERFTRAGGGKPPTIELPKLKNF
ncbi:MAG TPA: DUF3472 domain-containing protein [Gemmataceae bacterium]|nr:DUF3472 domain-containing protein [Gemmataceae bacterium]